MLQQVLPCIGKQGTFPCCHPHFPSAPGSPVGVTIALDVAIAEHDICTCAAKQRVGMTAI
jgi:hypothetical protein